MHNRISKMMSFSPLNAAVQPDNRRHMIDLPADSLQGRTAYDGLLKALCLKATKRRHKNLPPLKSAQFCFVAWSNDMLDTNPSTSTRWWSVRATADTPREGYSPQCMVIWSPDANPSLIARENVAILG